ncbi:hypothetical protein BH721_00160 [Clostridium baratii]|uniref:DUF1836 domain-containing protein n=2 Tax=Clostridium baratii TaxID=1561 RepID=A0A0A7FZP5_9CLOT|nr:DUF1836 domain-containing protein [Clostridium baratii]AIY84286.1 hypothetical protein U729_800 [Clostridium baratii str. Sullivan]OPF51043.1 hypothetical protein A1M12_06150 [Clostridium baratii]OPF53956.1 hypothetical protein BH724_03235 [Clostridium baratii]OPF57966.1 hypothetical protein BH721_00160 [Clostridium baratii]OPF61455.1 hypothetical protein BH725_12060 [Clostridium baratii]
MSNKINSDYINELAEEMSKNSMISYDDLPKYDLFLSQVIDYLNDKFADDKYTNNIVQNYIKSEVITKPEDGKKRGYTKLHLAQLVLLSYMRPILTTDEIKKVFSLAFNEINDRTDDIISWEDAYKLFAEMQKDSLETFLATSSDNEEKLDAIIDGLNLEGNEEERIRTFLLVVSLIAQASVIKKLVQKIVKEYHQE